MTAAPPARVARNFVVLTSSEIVGQVVAFVATAYLARVLGRDGFGLWVFAASIITYLGYVIDAGTETWGTREVSTDPGRLQPTLRAVITLRSVIAVATCLLLAAATLGMEGNRRLVLLCGMLTLVANALQVPWALRGLERMLPVAIGTLVQRATLMILALAWAKGAGSAPYVTLWQGVGDMAAALLWLGALLPMVRASAPSALPSPPLSLAQTLRQSWPFAVSRVLRGAMFALNVALIPLFWSDAMVGIYGVANRLAMPLLVLSGLFGMSVFPAITRACHVGGGREREALDATFRVLAAIFMPIVFGMAVLATPVVLFAFTQRYAGAVQPLRILLLGMACMVMSDNLRRILYARHRQLLDLRIVITAAVASVAFNLAGIAWLGASGAALAVLASEALLLALVVAGLARTGPAVRLASASLRPLVAAAAMAVAVSILPGVPLAVRIVLGAVIYGAVLLALGFRPLAEIHRIEAARSALDRTDDRDADPIDEVATA